MFDVVHGHHILLLTTLCGPPLKVLEELRRKGCLFIDISKCFLFCLSEINFIGFVTWNQTGDRCFLEKTL